MVAIRSKTDVPFGVLDNLFETQIFLDNQKWKSVYEYVFHPHKVPEHTAALNFEQFFQENDTRIVNEAIFTGINTKCEQNITFKKALLDLGEANIEYTHSTLLYGVDFVGNGQNVYGKWLTNIKNTLLLSDVNFFQNIIALDRSMKRLIYNSPIDEYLQMAQQGVSIKEILNVVEQKHGTVTDVPSLQICEKILNENSSGRIQVDAVSIIKNVMKKLTREVFYKNSQMYRLQVLAKFVNQTKRVHGIDGSPEDFNTDAFIKQLNSKERRLIEKQVYNHYIDEVKKGSGVGQLEPLLYIPSAKEIAINEKLTTTINDEKEKNTPRALVDHRNSVLSIDNEDAPFFVQGKTFSSIAQYVSYRLLNFHNVYGTDAYSELFVSPDNPTQFTSLPSVFEKIDKALNIHGQYLVDKLTNAIRAKVEQHSFVRDFIAATKFRKLEFKTGHNDAVTQDIYNQYRENVNWPALMHTKGKLLNNMDNFFELEIKLHFDRFFNILMCIFPNGFSEQDALRVYNEFYTLNDILEHTETPSDIYNINSVVQHLGSVFVSKCLGQMNALFSHIAEQISYKFMRAENLARKMFDNTDVVFMSKFLLVESQYKTHSGAMLDVNSSDYTDFEMEKLALLIVVKKICRSQEKKIPLVADIETAFYVFTETLCRKDVVNPCENTDLIKTNNSVNRVSSTLDNKSLFHLQKSTASQKIKTLLEELNADPEFLIALNKYAERLNNAPYVNYYSVHMYQS